MGEMKECQCQCGKKYQDGIFLSSAPYVNFLVCSSSENDPCSFSGETEAADVGCRVNNLFYEVTLRKRKG